MNAHNTLLDSGDAVTRHRTSMPLQCDFVNSKPRIDHRYLFSELTGRRNRPPLCYSILPPPIVSQPIFPEKFIFIGPASQTILCCRPRNQEQTGNGSGRDVSAYIRTTPGNHCRERPADRRASGSGDPTGSPRGGTRTTAGEGHPGPETPGRAVLERNAPAGPENAEPQAGRLVRAQGPSPTSRPRTQ